MVFLFDATLWLTESGWETDNPNYRALAGLLGDLLPNVYPLLPNGGSPAVIEAARLLDGDYELPSWVWPEEMGENPLMIS